MSRKFVPVVEMFEKIEESVDLILPHIQEFAEKFDQEYSNDKDKSPFDTVLQQMNECIEQLEGNLSLEDVIKICCWFAENMRFWLGGFYVIEKGEIQLSFHQGSKVVLRPFKLVQERLEGRLDLPRHFCHIHN